MKKNKSKGIEIYLALVKEFPLRPFESVHNEEHYYAKYMNFQGFVVDAYTTNDYVSIPTGVDVDRNSDVFYFWGAENFYDLESAKKQVMKIISEAKQIQVQVKKDEIDGDFVKLNLHKN